MTRKRLLCAAVWIAALAACLILADRLTRRDDGERKYGPFFENADEAAYDVLFFGTSRVLNGVLPVELWRDYGITSYNMGNNSEPLGVTKWVMRMAFDYHKPKAALIDAFYIDRGTDEEWAYTFRHLFLDEIPLSRRKIECVTSTLPKDHWVEFLMPFSLYHGRWEEMMTGNVERLVDTEPVMMGAEFRVGISWPSAVNKTDEADTSEQIGWNYIRAMVALCRENGVTPVLMCLPSAAEIDEIKRVNGVAALAEELGVPYINMMGMDGLVDYRTDYYDANFHLNPDGASKVTAYLGQWLTDSGLVEDRRGQAGTESWDALVPQYEAYRAEKWGAYSAAGGQEN